MLAVLSCLTLELTCILGTQKANRWNMEGLDLIIDLHGKMYKDNLLQIIVNTADCSVHSCENEPSVAARCPRNEH